jgi:2-keto-4-pentenoate hydratase/2-oxohepta-3-ene-1,7-dioic acid hydratase in catechol pathway
MKICHYNANQAGAVVGDQVYPIADTLIKAGLLRSGYTMLEVIEVLANQPAAMRLVEDFLQAGSPAPLRSVKLLAPLLNPPSLWAAAANYRDHQTEMQAKGGAPDRSALSKDDLMAEFFLKPPSSIVGQGGPVIIPRISKHVDLECELCAVIGKTARYVTEEKALDYVFGYTICWDISQRDPWGRGRNNTRNIRKGFDTFTGLGPWIVTKDEIDEPQNLSITVEQNGELVMRGHTRDMICGLRDHIRFLSGILTLRPGVLITTGTPAGVSKLSPGDHLKGSIEKIGQMEMDVRAEG